MARMNRQWQPPPTDWFKVNFDGSFSTESLTRGWGVIARDSDSVPIVTAAGPLSLVSEALLCAIRVSDERGFGRVMFSTDCQNLMHGITSNKYDLAPLGAFFYEAKY